MEEKVTQWDFKCRKSDRKYHKFQNNERKKTHLEAFHRGNDRKKQWKNA